MATYIFVDTSLREELEQLQLAERTQAEQGVLEGEHLLDCDLLPRWLVHSRHDRSIGAFTKAVKDLVVFACE